ncbi:MAG: toxin-antitoxin system, antitoxin component, Xre family protein [Pseudomonadota bacterium]
MGQGITPTSDKERILIQKIRTLSPDKISEIEDFVDFLSQRDRDRQLLNASDRMAESNYPGPF